MTARIAVVRVDDALRAGVRFTALADEDRVRLTHLAFAMTRRARRRLV
jgi:hypothetical protein